MQFTRQGMNTIGKELHDAFISVEEAAVKALHHGHVDHKQGSGVGHVPEEVWRERQTQVVQVGLGFTLRVNPRPYTLDSPVTASQSCGVCLLL